MMGISSVNRQFLTSLNEILEMPWESHSLSPGLRLVTCVKLPNFCHMTSAIMALQCVLDEYVAFFHSAPESQSVKTLGFGPGLHFDSLHNTRFDECSKFKMSSIDYIYHTPTDCFIVPVQNWVNVNPYRIDGVEQTVSLHQDEEESRFTTFFVVVLWPIVLLCLILL